MKIQEEVNQMILELKKDSRINTLDAFIPNTTLFYSFYASITGFLDGNYFSIYIKSTNNCSKIRATVCRTTDQKRKLNEYLKTVFSYKFITKI
jgi:hypothetical protein